MTRKNGSDKAMATVGDSLPQDFGAASTTACSVGITNTGASYHLETRFRSWELVPEALRRVFERLAAGELPWPLFLHGKAGRGKTCAALAMLDRVNAGRRYQTVPDLLDELRRCMSGKHEHDVTEREFWERYERIKFFVLDEIGARERVSDFHYDVIKRVFDLRHAKPFVVCSNLSIGELATVYDDRIADRLAEGTRYEFTGESMRKAQGVKA